MLTTKDAAQALALSVRTLERLRLSGLGPRYVKVGKCVRYRVSDIEAFVASRVITSTSESVEARQ
jgi:predicted DNA-binding transcriptional regulator AlpA